MKKQQVAEKIIDTSQVRLSQEETREMLRIIAAGKPVVGGYRTEGLADIGILRKIEISEEEDTSRKIEECWARAEDGMTRRSLEIVHSAMHSLEHLMTDRDHDRPVYLYELTELGKRVAGTISIRLSAALK